MLYGSNGNGDKDKNMSNDANKNIDIDMGLIPPSKTNNIENIITGKYYAVFFMVRRKKSFYIGSPISNTADDVSEVETKFLEKRLVRNEFLYDWPRRQDVCVVEKRAVIREINFTGPPQFSLNAKLAKELNDAADVLNL